MKVLLVSSSGGHWVQMCRVKDAFQGEDIYFASTEKSYGQHNPENSFFYLPDASRWNKLKLIWQSFSVLLLLIRLKPDIILTTGASVGVFALILGKKLGARTIWLDSIANSEELSLSGQKVRKYADLYLTQWQHLATNKGPEYAGSVI